MYENIQTFITEELLCSTCRSFAKKVAQLKKLYFRVITIKILQI